MIVVKIGGSIAANADPVLDELADTPDTVLVHGFGPQTTEHAREQGVETRWITSPDGVRSRFTDQETLDAMQEAAREVGQRLTDALEERGRSATRVPGRDVLRAEAKPALRHEREDGRTVLVRGNRSGRVVDADPKLVHHVLADDELPVLTPLACDDEGPVSVDADRAAAAIAAELDASALVLLTDVERVLDGSGEPIDQLDPDEAQRLIDENVAEGGMLRKLVASREALEAGVEHVVVGDGQRARPIEQALSGDATEVRA